MQHSRIIEAIETSPLNRGLKGFDWFTDPDNVPIVDGDDIALFDGEGDGVYQGHMLFESRGRKAIEFGRYALKCMFEDFDARLIYGLTPVFLRPAKIMNRWLGFKYAGLRATPHGLCEVYILSRQAWERKIH